MHPQDTLPQYDQSCPAWPVKKPAPCKSCVPTPYRRACSRPNAGVHAQAGVNVKADVPPSSPNALSTTNRLQKPQRITGRLAPISLACAPQHHCASPSPNPTASPGITPTPQHHQASPSPPASPGIALPHTYPRPTGSPGITLTPQHPHASLSHVWKRERPRCPSLTRSL